MITSAIVTIMISNMQKSIDFYTKVLGMKLTERYEDDWASVEGFDMKSP